MNKQDQGVLWKPWRQRDFFFVGLLAAVVFLVSFLFGAGIIAATGIPATGGLGNIFAAVFLLVVGFHIVPKRFFGTVTLALMFALAIPTTIGGPIGPLKVVNGILIGLTFDLFVILGRKAYWSKVLGASLAAVVSLWGVYWGLIILGLPGIERLAPLMVPLSAAQAILGLVAAVIAIRTYRYRLEDWPAVRRFRDQ